MYWIFLIFFIITILIPDIVRSGFYFLSEARVEEIAIFLMGATVFLIFLKSEQQLIFHKKEKEKDQRKIDQTVKDLIESYSYIGEVNRKIDLLINIALGFSDRSILSKSKEKEIYQAIVKGAGSLFQTKKATLRFVDMETGKTKKEIRLNPNGHDKKAPKNKDLVKIVKKAQNNSQNLSKDRNILIGFSSHDIDGIRSFIIVYDYNKEEEADPKNSEILKVFASQALFLYSYTHNQQDNCEC